MPYKDPEVKKAKHKEYSKKYYEANKEAHGKRVSARKKELRVLWSEFKATLSCQHCGETHPATFDFHHIKKDPTNRKVHKLLQSQNYNSAREEIKKCMVLCANCHRKHHYEERKNPAL
jgi:transcription elongation factor Elf1